MLYRVKEQGKDRNTLFDISVCKDLIGSLFLFEIYFVYFLTK